MAYLNTPASTNAQEAKHQDYYRVSKTEQTIREAIRSLYTYAKADEATLEYLLQGEDVRYGNKKPIVMLKDTPRKKRDAPTSSDEDKTSKGSLKKKATNQRKPVAKNDNPAPDSNARLFG